jgi:hypothetical protein
MNRNRNSVLVVLPLVLAGCLAGHMNSIMSSWQGHHYSELIMRWGPPQAVFDDGTGGRILVYTVQRQWTSPGKSETYTTAQATIYDNMIWGQAQSVTQYTPPQTYGYTAWREFRINRSGIIYSWSWRGL